ncbi:hypothetical protein [Bythopirellula polymerisocia]|uniref:hypothetical protein n=1 Tax=Bythopirellula polymerisocia TaxID=2528003 RepID=UPI0011B3E66C|nr:hypothetical protein [Bythopirellula polymerisocia]
MHAIALILEDYGYHRDRQIGKRVFIRLAKKQGRAIALLASDPVVVLLWVYRLPADGYQLRIVPGSDSRRATAGDSG